MSFNDLLKSHLFTLGNLQYQKDSFVKGSQCLCWASLAEASPHVSRKDRLVTVPGGGHSVCNPGNLRSILLVWPGVCKHEAPNCCQLRCISKTRPRGSLIIHYQQHVKASDRLVWSDRWVWWVWATPSIPWLLLKSPGTLSASSVQHAVVKVQGVKQSFYISSRMCCQLRRPRPSNCSDSYMQ